MDEKINLAEFDEVGISSSPPSSPNSNAQLPKNLPPKNPTNPKKVAIGCVVFFFILFTILIGAMIFGLRAGEETITNFGLEPTSFKNWTIGMVSILFGSLSLFSIIAIVYFAGQRLLVEKTDFVKKAKAFHHSLLSGFALIVFVALWYFIYGYISQFQMANAELPIEIVTDPEYTYELTSPIQVDFSAERIIDNFKANYDLVSYEWDKESDGKVDATGAQTTLYFPHGGENSGVYNVNLRVRLQPKDAGDIVVKEYQKIISISNQEIYGEIVANNESGEIPLTVKFDADEIFDPDGSEILNYSWDLDNDGRPDRDGPSYRTTTQTFETIGEHNIVLTVTSEDFDEDGTHEQKIFEKTITVFEPASSSDVAVEIEASSEKGVAPLAVNFTATQKNLTGSSANLSASNYNWKIGDGLETLSGKKVKYTFAKPGTYPVELAVTFYNGLVKRDTLEIFVTDESVVPEAAIQTDPAVSRQYKSVAGPAPFTVEFDASGSTDEDDNIVKYEWDFDGDGLWDEEGSLVEHKFRDEGEYTATLRVTDSDENESRAEVAITVSGEIPVIDFGASRLAGVAPLTIDFDASGSRLPAGEEIISYEWDFSAAKSGSKKQTFIYERAQTSHIFEAVGEHIVKLTLHSDSGKEYSDSIKLIATYPSLSAKFSISRTSGNAPLEISFDSSESSGSISRLEWTFNDGATSSEKAPNHIFREPGRYDVVLRVFDSNGNVATKNQEIIVK